MSQLEGFHLASDFDGVWTDPTDESLAIEHTMAREFASLGGLSQERAQQRLLELRRAVLNNPQQFGWKVDGALTSYVDEDYFAIPAAIGQCLETCKDSEAQQILNGIGRRYAHLTEFLDNCYHGTCSRFRQNVEHDLVHGAAPVMQWLLDNGVHVTFVTNAPIEKVVDWFGAVGFTIADARQVPFGEAPLRAYGRAGKQWLGNVAAGMSFRGRFVRTDRPQYREILECEKPDMMLGDVLSIDLALPIYLRSRSLPGAPRQVALVVRPDAPAWVTESVGPDEDKVNHILPHITSLPRILREASLSSTPHGF